MFILPFARLREGNVNRTTVNYGYSRERLWVSRPVAFQRVVSIRDSLVRDLTQSPTRLSEGMAAVWRFPSRDGPGGLLGAIWQTPFGRLYPIDSRS